MTRFSSINSAVSRSNTISDQWFVTWQSPRPALTVLKMILSNIFGVVATHASKNILKPLNKKIFSGFTLGKFKTPFWSVVSWQSLLWTGKWSIPWTIAVILSGFTLGRVEAESQAAVSCLLTTTVFIWKYLVLLQQTRLENESLKKTFSGFTLGKVETQSWTVVSNLAVAFRAKKTVSTTSHEKHTFLLTRTCKL